MKLKQHTHTELEILDKTMFKKLPKNNQKYPKLNLAPS